MGNCTSKKSRKSLKLSATQKPLFHNKMDKELDTHTKGLSKKVAPFSKGEVTSFGFKKKLTSQLPVPITLTSNGHAFHEANGKFVQNGPTNHRSLSDGYQSGSSVESLCHAPPFRSTPKMVRKSRDLVKQVISAESNEPESKAGSKSIKTTSSAVPISLGVHNENINSGNGNIVKASLEPTVNRFGFRQPAPPRATNNIGKGLKNNAISQNTRTAFLTSQEPYETGPYSTVKKLEVSTRSKSEGPREAFFKQNIQPANSVQSGLNQSRASLTNNLQPGKFTFQTSHLPRPQFAVRMSDPKTAKTAANYYRKGGARNESNHLTNEDSGFESHPSANNTLERHIEILESSPGSKIRRRLPAIKGKKLEMKIVGNKFELMKKDEENSSDVVTEISLIKLPTSSIKNSTAIINTGLVEQRTNQYLKKISQPFNRKDFDLGPNDPDKTLTRTNTKISADSSSRDEGLGAESEEEKLFKDSKKSEKSSMKYSMSDGCGDGDDMMPGETMAEDVSLCLSFEEDTSTGGSKKIPERPAFLPGLDVTPNTIRLDALKLSKELKCKNNVADAKRKGGESTSEFLVTCERDEDTFPSDSILEQLSDSDSLGDKGENKNNDKEKNIKIANINLDKEDLGIDVDEVEEISKSDTDVDENDLDLNIDETEIKDDNKNCLGTTSPGSPDTPTHASNSLSLSDGRDFLIDDEIADQPQLCLSESYVDCSCHDEVKASNERTMTVNNEFVTCCDVQTNTVQTGEQLNGNGEEAGKGNVEIIERVVSRGERRRLNSEGTLSPCESITSDDLMLDFETNSIEETAGRFDVNENISVENFDISRSRDDIRDVSCQRLNGGLTMPTLKIGETLLQVKNTTRCNNRRSGGEKSLKTKEVNSNCSTPASAKSLEIVSRAVYAPYRSSRSTPADDDSIKLDKISYQNMFQDIIGIKAMLLNLKRLLLESEGGLQENGRVYPEDGTLDNFMEDELTDLRRQVLFLQQQLEEREKMVQVLRLKISQTSDSGTVATDSRKQSNAATQTGLDQFQQDFPHFRVFQTTPVV